jgi:arylsulfatase A-like enzyme
MTRGQRRNVFLISIDSMRYDAISASRSDYRAPDRSGAVLPRTDSIDWFADHGTLYDACITTAPYTTAAHASVLTGQWPINHGLQVYFKNPIYSKTVFEKLSARDFATVLFTDFPVIMGSYLGFTRGVKSFVACDENELIEELRGYEDQNLFGLFHFAGAHFPYGFNPIKRQKERFAAEVHALSEEHKIALPQQLQPDWVETYREESEELLAQQYKYILFELHKRQEWATLIDLYTSGLNKFANERFSPFIDRLDDMGYMEDSLFVIFGDHGEKWSNQSKGHFQLWEEVIRVPLIFSGAGVDKNRVIRKQVRLIDIVPTALNWLGEGVLTVGMDGISLLEPESVPDDLKAFTQVWAYDKKSAIRFVNDTVKSKTLNARAYPSYLHKESLRWNGLKLMNRYLPTEECEAKQLFDVSSVEREVNDESSLKIYDQELTKFNANSKFDPRGVCVIPKTEEERLRREFISLGYDLNQI